MAAPAKRHGLKVKTANETGYEVKTLWFADEGERTRYTAPEFSTVTEINPGDRNEDNRRNSRTTHGFR